MPGEPASKNDLCLTTRVTLTVVLPSTTTLQKITAHFGSQEKRYLLSVYRNSKGEVIEKGDSDISVIGLYSDGVERQLTTDVLTFMSVDEKVVVVGPKFDKRYALATAVSVGETEIIVKQGALSDHLTVKVINQNCPDNALNKDGKLNYFKCTQVFK